MSGGLKGGFDELTAEDEEGADDPAPDETLLSGLVDVLEELLSSDEVVVPEELLPAEETGGSVDVVVPEELPPLEDGV